MRRREFITRVGVAATISQLAAHAQQGQRVWRIGALIALGGSAEQAFAEKVIQGLGALSWHGGPQPRALTGAGPAARLRSTSDTRRS